MQISTRFSVGVHILALVYFCRDGGITSERMAGSVNTNPVVVRRIMGQLKRAGLIYTTPGVAGAILARPPEAITLLDVYHAVDAVHNTLFDVHENTNPACPVGANIQAALESALTDAQAAMENTLRRVTIADVIAGIQARA
jgi:Rrf2 family protein